MYTVLGLVVHVLMMGGSDVLVLGGGVLVLVADALVVGSVLVVVVDAVVVYLLTLVMDELVEEE